MGTQLSNRGQWKLCGSKSSWKAYNNLVSVCHWRRWNTSWSLCCCSHTCRKQPSKCQLDDGVQRAARRSVKKIKIDVSAHLTSQKKKSSSVHACDHNPASRTILVLRATEVSRAVIRTYSSAKAFTVWNDVAMVVNKILSDQLKLKRKILPNGVLSVRITTFAHPTWSYPPILFNFTTNQVGQGYLGSDGKEISNDFSNNDN